MHGCELLEMLTILSSISGLHLEEYIGGEYTSLQIPPLLRKGMIMRFLERRDYDFDIVKSYLIVSMTIAHAIQWFYIPVYNKHLTYYVLIGFVFLSGLTVGSVYQKKLLTQPIHYTWVILSRALKLLVIFLLLNTLIILLSPDKAMHFLKMRPADLLVSALLRDGQVRFSFAVLVPISLTFVGSIALLSWRMRSLDIILMGLGIGALWVIENTSDFDYLGLKMLIVGLVAVLSAKALTCVNWEKVRGTLSKWLFVVWTCYIVYQTGLIIVDKEWDLLVGHYINVTVLLMLAIYLTSFHIGFINYRLPGLLNKSLAKHMLFAYLFHLLILGILTQFIRRSSLLMPGTIVVCVFTLGVTTLSCLLVENLTIKYRTINRVYSVFFR